MLGLLPETIAVVSHGNAMLHSPKDRDSLHSALMENYFPNLKGVKFFREREGGPGEEKTSVEFDSVGEWLYTYSGARPALSVAVFFRTIDEGDGKPKRRSLSSGIHMKGDGVEELYFRAGYYRDIAAYQSCAIPASVDFGESVEDSTQKLCGVLLDAVALCETIGGAITSNRQYPEWAAHWKKVFSDAVAQFESENPDPEICRQPLPEKFYSLQARRLVAAAIRTFTVFGGMGSWSDIGFPDKQIQTQYEALSGFMHTAAVKGMLSAANSFEYSPGMFEKMKNRLFKKPR